MCWCVFKRKPYSNRRWGTAAGSVPVDQMAWEAGTAATSTGEMPQISEACPDLLPAVYWRSSTSGLHVSPGARHFLPISLPFFLSQAKKSQGNVLRFTCVWWRCKKGILRVDMKSFTRMLIMKERHTKAHHTDSFLRCISSKSKIKIKEAAAGPHVLGGRHRFMEPDVLPIQQTVKEFHWTQRLCYITAITAVNTRGAAEKRRLNAILFAALLPETWLWQVSPQPWTAKAPKNAELQ